MPGWLFPEKKVAGFDPGGVVEEISGRSCRAAVASEQVRGITMVVDMRTILVMLAVCLATFVAVAQQAGKPCAGESKGRILSDGKSREKSSSHPRRPEKRIPFWVRSRA